MIRPILRGVVIAHVVVASLGAQQPAARDDSVNIRLVNTELRAAVQIMSQYLSRPVVFTGTGSVMVTLETPQPVPRSNVLRLLRGLLESQNYELVDDTVASLYRARPREPVRAPPPPDPAASRQAAAPEVFVIAIKHARAADVATTVNALYGRGSPLDNRTRPQTLGDELRANQVPPMNAPAPQPALAGNGGRAALLSGDITIVPDARANSLLIRANRADYELIQAVVQQVDVPVLQVLIEALVVEVRRNKSLDISADGTLSPTSINKAGATASATAGSPGLADFALQVMHVGGVNLETNLRMASLQGDVHIVSRPVVLTENSHEASIVVGSQRPFVQVARALPTDAPLRDQVVQYKEVGTKLSVRPTISSDGSVQLEVTQEVSSATGETQFDAPVISQRSVQTQLLVQDGQTIVLGGLTDQEHDVTRGGIPVLSSIPLLGGLFGRQSRSTTETELFIFLTPRVIRNAADADQLSKTLKARADKVSP